MTEPKKSDFLHDMRTHLKMTELTSEILNKKNNIKNAFEEAKSSLMPGRYLDEQLEEIEENALYFFLNTEEITNKKKINEKFKKHLLKYSADTNLLIKKYISNNTQTQNENKYLNEQIQNLRDQYTQVKLENNELKLKIKQHTSEIERLQKKFEDFETSRPYMEKFLVEYKGKTPKEVIFELNSKMKEAADEIEELVELRRTNIQLNKNVEELELKLNESISKYSQLKKEENEKYLKNQQKYFDEINSLNIKIIKIENAEKENISLKNCLFTIYNNLFEVLRLDKGLNINTKYLDLTIDDFRANIYNNEEIKSYIQRMINSAHDESAGKVYRQTIAIANMMLRKYLSKKLELKFKPVEIFMEIKKLIEDTNNKYDNCKRENDLLHKQIKDIKNINKKLNEKLKIEKDSFQKYQIITQRIAAEGGDEVEKQLAKMNDINIRVKFKNKNIQKNKVKVFCKTDIIDKDTNININDKEEVIENENEKEETNNNININNKKRRAISSIPNKKKPKQRNALLINPDDLEKYDSTNTELMQKFNYIPNTLQKQEEEDIFNYINKKANKKRKLKLNKKENNNSLSNYISKNNKLPLFKKKINKEKNCLSVSHGSNQYIYNIKGIHDFVDQSNRLILYRAKMAESVKWIRKEPKIENRFLKMNYINNNNNKETKEEIKEKVFNKNVLKNISKLLSDID